MSSRLWEVIQEGIDLISAFLMLVRRQILKDIKKQVIYLPLGQCDGGGQSSL